MPLVIVTDANNCIIQSNAMVPNPIDLNLTATITSEYSGILKLVVKMHLMGSFKLVLLEEQEEYSYSIDGGVTFLFFN